MFSGLDIGRCPYSTDNVVVGSEWSELVTLIHVADIGVELRSLYFAFQFTVFVDSLIEISKISL